MDLGTFRNLGLPFWLAGSRADPQKLKEAISQGATGIQVGTVFAYCEESGLLDQTKRGVLDQALKGDGKRFSPIRSLRPQVFPSRSCVWKEPYPRTKNIKPGQGLATWAI